MKYTFDQIPEVLHSIEKRLEKIESLLAGEATGIDEESEYIGAEAAREILGISLATLYTKVHHREVPFYKKGNKLYFNRIELLEWIKQGRKKSFEEIREGGRLLLKNIKNKNRGAPDL